MLLGTVDTAKKRVSELGDLLIGNSKTEKQREKKKKKIGMRKMENRISKKCGIAIKEYVNNGNNRRRREK